MSISNQGPEGMILGGRYRIARLIGSGGMANVYLATDMSSGIHVAIKILKSEFAADEEFIKRFDTEAKAASSLSHPNIVRVLGVGQEGEFRYMVQEYVEGITAKELITQNGHLDWRVAVPIAIQVGMALDHAHQNGIVHRDIKPHNILITRDRIAKVTDFGIARAASNNTITLTSGGALGSVHYFSPEQARGAMVGPSTDIYSLGVLLFEMVTGRVPFDGDTSVAIAIKHLQEPPPLASGFVPGIPAGLDAIIQKSMQKSIDYRYPTIREMVTEMDALMVDPNGSYGILAKSDILDATTNQMQAMRHDPNYGKLRDIEHSIEKRRRSRTKDNVLVILLITVILGVLLSTVYLVTKVVFGNLSSTENTSFSVENYVGSPITEVLANFEKQKFTSYKVTYEASSDYAPGIVFWQSIESGVQIKPDNGLHTLELKVSAEQDSITLPDYQGYDLAKAQAEILSLKLTVRTQPETSNTVDVGKVIRTEPAANSLVASGSEVVLIISQGKTTVFVPELSGVTLTKAKQTITDSDLILGTVQVNPAAQALPEENQIVLYSDPIQNTEVSPKSSINLFVGTYEDYQNYVFKITPTPTPTLYMLTLPTVTGGKATGGGTYAEGSQVTVTAVPSDGYNFKSWVDESSVVVGTSVSLTFIMPSQNVTLTPVFVTAAATTAHYQLTVTPDPYGGGTVTGTTSGAYAEKQQLSMTAVPSAGYKFDHWTDDTRSTYYGNSTTFNIMMPSRNLSVVAVFVVDSSSTPPAA
jgi:serine/threonine-protein kinase